MKNSYFFRREDIIFNFHLQYFEKVLHIYIQLRLSIHLSPYNFIGTFREFRGKWHFSNVYAEIALDTIYHTWERKNGFRAKEIETIFQGDATFSFLHAFIYAVSFDDYEKRMS